MKTLIVCVLLGVLIGIMPPLLPAQQNQNTQKSNPEIEALEQRISELEKQLRTVENVEKIDLQAKLAEANVKLANAEFGKFERELRDSNDGWLIKWGIFALTLLAIVGAGALTWIKSRTNQLIADGVEENLNGFKEAVDQVDILKNQFEEAMKELGVLKNQQRILEKEHATATLEDFVDGIHPLLYEYLHRERIKGIGEEALLDVFADEGKPLAIRYRAAEVLAARRSPQLVSPMLKFLNSVIDSDSDIKLGLRLGGGPFVNLLGEIHTRKTHEALTIFLNRLFAENQKHRDLFLTWTALSLAEVSVKLDIRDSAAILRKSIPYLDLCPGAGIRSIEQMGRYLQDLVEYFDALDDPETIKKILRDTQIRRQFDGIVNQCLRLLQKCDGQFVAEWRARETTDNSNT